MSRVRIVQLLCPARHCILGTAYESENGEALPGMSDLVRTAFKTMVEGGWDPWCGICKSRDLKTEDAPTRWATMEEAKPYLERSEREQARAREFLRGSRN